MTIQTTVTAIPDLIVNVLRLTGELSAAFTAMVVFATARMFVIRMAATRFMASL